MCHFTEPRIRISSNLAHPVLNTVPGKKWWFDECVTFNVAEILSYLLPYTWYTIYVQCLACSWCSINGV